MEHAQHLFQRTENHFVKDCEVSEKSLFHVKHKAHTVIIIHSRVILTLKISLYIFTHSWIADGNRRSTFTVINLYNHK